MVDIREFMEKVQEYGNELTEHGWDHKWTLDDDLYTKGDRSFDFHHSRSTQIACVTYKAPGTEISSGIDLFEPTKSGFIITAWRMDSSDCIRKYIIGRIEF